MRRLPALLIAGLLAAAAAAGSSVDRGPYSGAPSASSVTISWSANPLVPARVEYSSVEGYEESGVLRQSVIVSVPEEGDARRTMHVRLEELRPATDYLYRIVLSDGDVDLASPTGAFRTAPAPGTPVSFVVLSDTQWQWEGENRLKRVGDAISVDREPYDFILHAGDLVESPAEHYWDHWFASFDKMLLRAPFIPVLGNHEKNHRSYYEAFELPPGGGRDEKRWWALHWGDLVVVGLDTNVRRPDEMIEQQEWAREHLSGPEPHKFVIFHHPVFSSDAYHGGGYSYDVIYHPIFVEAGVDIVFNGHAHNYERIESDGVIYLVVGGGGATPRPLSDERVPGSIVAIEDYLFYARIRTDHGTLRVETVAVARIEGETMIPIDEVIDAFTLPARATETPMSPFRPVFAIGALGSASVVWLLFRGLSRSLLRASGRRPTDRENAPAGNRRPGGTRSIGRSGSTSGSLG